MTIEIKKKLIKIGNGYAILIPKALVECKVLNTEDELIVKIEQDNKCPVPMNAENRQNARKLYISLNQDPTLSLYDPTSGVLFEKNLVTGKCEYEQRARIIQNN